MKVPNVTPTELVAYIEANGDPESQPTITFGHEDPNLHEAELETLISKLESLVPVVNQGEKGYDKAKETLDAAAASILFPFFEQLSAATVLDGKFWAYLNFRLYRLVNWRHPGGKLINFGTNFANFQESFLGRSYLRGKIGQTQKLIEVPGSDLWRSHIIRVKAGNSRDVAQSILSLVKTKKLTAEKMRPLARRVNAYRSNIVFEVLGKAGATRAIELIWDEYEQSPDKSPN